MGNLCEHFVFLALEMALVRHFQNETMKMNKTMNIDMNKIMNIDNADFALP